MAYQVVSDGWLVAHLVWALVIVFGGLTIRSIWRLWRQNF